MKEIWKVVQKSLRELHSPAGAGASGGEGAAYEPVQ